MKFKYKRSERVAELVREEVAKIISTEIKDPRVGFVTITKVDLSPDLKNVTLFVSVMGEEEKKKDTLKGLERSAGFIRKMLGQRLYLKRIPEVRFKLDLSIEYSDKISNILNAIKEEERKKEDDKRDT